MEEFGDNFDQNDVDPAAEFLAREQSELGAIIDDELKPSTNTSRLNGDGVHVDGHKENSGSSFEMIDGLDQDCFDKEHPLATPSPPLQKVREEPEQIKTWREDQIRRLEEKDKAEEVKKGEWRETAKKELEDWYKNHEETIAKTKAANRNAEKQFVADDNAIEPGTEWERIAKLCDFNPKAKQGSKDVSRMRSMILQLKQAPLAIKNNA